MMEARRPFETSDLTRAAQRYIPEDGILNTALLIAYLYLMALFTSVAHFTQE
jgi:hypothetical protein